MTTRTRILELARDNRFSNTEIARRVGVSQSRVSQILSSNGIRRGRGFQATASNRRPTQRTRNAEICALYKTGAHTHRTLAERFGLSRQRVEQIVNPRPRKPAKAFKARMNGEPFSMKHGDHDTITTAPSSPVPTTFADRLRAKIQDLTDLLARVEQLEPALQK